MGRQSFSLGYLGEITKCITSVHRVMTPRRLILTVKEIREKIMAGLVELDL